MNRDDRSRALIEREIRAVWADIVQSVNVAPRIDYLDEPAFDVLVELHSIQQVPESIARGRMLARLGDALRESGDERGTHIAFSAPDEEVEIEIDEMEEPRGGAR